MEAAIIVEGFNTSIEMHGLIYAKFVGYGESSVYRKILEAMPYGPEIRIKKSNVGIIFYVII